MAGENVHPKLHRALFGFRRDGVEALQSRLTQTESDLATVRGENAQLDTALRSARSALGESVGWSTRLPVALGELGRIAAGDVAGDDVQLRLAAAVLALAGEHLLAQVQVALGDPIGELQTDTRWNENRRPIRTLVSLGGCRVDCAWQPAVDAGPDTVRIIEGLCSAVVCSLVGVVTSRVERHNVSQLGDERALSRHLALRQRLEEPCELVAVSVDERSAIRHSELYGRVAWDAALADAASVLDRLARTRGGQAYHTADHHFRVVVDLDHGEEACDLIRQELEIYDDLIFTVNLADR